MTSAGKNLSLFDYVPFYKSNLDRPELRRFLLDFLESERKKDNSVHKSNRGGFQTRDICREKFANDFLHGFKDEIAAYMKRFQIHRNFRVDLTGLWVNSNFRDHFNMPHTHSPDFFSGVWYLKVPHNSGDICFMNPIQALTYNYHYFFGDGCFQDSATYHCKDNDLIMFPSFVEHLVMPNQTDEERISVAFNYNLAP